jgi:hypothetical protein
MFGLRYFIPPKFSTYSSWDVELDNGTERVWGVTIPTDMMALIASSTVNWEGSVFSLGRKRRKP